MFQFINTILIGLTSGAIYSLMALAIVLVWRSTRVINFAQAGLALASTYIGYQVLQVIDNYWLALLIAMIAGAALSAFIELAFMRVLLKMQHCKGHPFLWSSFRPLCFFGRSACAVMCGVM